MRRFVAMVAVLAAFVVLAVPEVAPLDEVNATSNAVPVVPMADGVSATVAAKVAAVLAADGVPASVAVEVAAVLAASDVPATVAVNVAAVLAAAGAPATVVAQFPTALAILQATTTKAQFAVILSESTASPVVVAIAEALAVAEAHGVPSFAVAAALSIPCAGRGGLKERFDMVHPAPFTALWEIKRAALAAAARGENTDALWRQYWHVFALAALAGEE